MMPSLLGFQEIPFSEGLQAAELGLGKQGTNARHRLRGGARMAGLKAGIYQKCPLGEVPGIWE